MTEKEPSYNLSRRRVLGGLGAIGLASAGAGLGTSAFFSDSEPFEGNVLTAGELNLIVNYFSWWDQGSAGSDSRLGSVDGTTVSGILEDIKPGDGGTLGFCFEIVDNPAYLWTCGSLVANDDNGLTEPEGEVDETGGEGEGELADAIKVDVYYGDISVPEGEDFDPTTDVSNQSDALLSDVSLAEFLTQANSGLALDGTGAVGQNPGEQAPFAGSSADGSNPCLVIDWWVPTDVGNEIQSDSLEFDLLFSAMQARHNDGTANPCLPEAFEATTGTGDFSQISYEKAFGMQALSRAGSGRGEIQIHGDSGGVENTTLWGPDPGDTFPADTDVEFTAVVDPDAETASLTVNEVTVTDDDVTDGDANGAATGEPEWPGGVPSAVDIAITASSGDSLVTTVVDEVTINGIPVSPDTVSATGGLTHLDITGVPAATTVTVEGILRFEGSTSDFDGQDFVGIDWR